MAAWSHLRILKLDIIDVTGTSAFTERAQNAQQLIDIGRAEEVRYLTLLESAFRSVLVGLRSSHSTRRTLYILAPPGVSTSMASSLVFPINARAIGEVTEIFPLCASASGSPTICHTFFPPVSSSISVTVAPNLIVSPE